MHFSPFLPQFLCIVALVLLNNRAHCQTKTTEEASPEVTVKLVVTEYTPANRADVQEATFKLLVANQSKINFDLLRVNGVITGMNGKVAKWEHLFKEGMQAGSKGEALVTCDLGGTPASQITLNEVKALSDFELVRVKSSMLSIVDGLEIAGSPDSEKSKPEEMPSSGTERPNNSLLIDFTQPNIVYLNGAEWIRGSKFEVVIKPVLEEGIPSLRTRKNSFIGSPTNPNDYHLAISGRELRIKTQLLKDGDNLLFLKITFQKGSGGDNVDFNTLARMLDSANSVIGVSKDRAEDATKVRDDRLQKQEDREKARQQEILARLKASSARGIINEYYPTATAMSRLQGNLAYEIEIFEVDSEGRRGDSIATFK